MLFSSELSNKSFLALTEIFACVIASTSCLASIKSRAFGWSEEIVNIKAPRLPSCPIILVVVSYNCIKGTGPTEVLAALFTRAPAGLNLLKSVPVPPP